MSENNQKDLGKFLNQKLINFGIQEVINSENGVTDIAVNRPYEFWYKNNIGWHKVDNDSISFNSLMDFAIVFANYNQAVVNFENPIFNGVLPSGKECQVIIPPAVENNIVAIVIKL